MSYTRVAEARSQISCGVRQLFALPRLERKLSRLKSMLAQYGLEDSFGDRSSMASGWQYLFSDADYIGNGRWLAEQIVKHDLGELISMSNTNPNSGNQITTWLWRWNGNVPKIPRKKKTKAKTRT